MELTNELNQTFEEYKETEDSILKHLTAHEQKEWRCAPVLPPPGGEVVRDLLTRISGLRREVEICAHDYREATDKWDEFQASTNALLKRLATVEAAYSEQFKMRMEFMVALSDRNKDFEVEKEWRRHLQSMITRLLNQTDLRCQRFAGDQVTCGDIDLGKTSYPEGTEPCYPCRLRAEAVKAQSPMWDQPDE